MHSPRHDPQALLDHDDFLRALARRLVADAAHADDVVQQAYLAALELERAPAGPAAAPIRSLRAWLAGIVRHLAARRVRADERRVRLEAAVARGEATPSVAEIVAREEARRRVVAAVLRLEEPARSAVVLRFFERLPPRVIARRLGVPVETVRTRIKRAIERLRAELDALHDGRRSDWLALLAPFTLPPPLPPLATSTAALATALSHLSVGVLLMSTKAKLCAAAVVAASAALGWYVLVDTEPLELPPRANADSSSAGIARPATVDDAAPPAVTVAAERAPAASPAATETASTPAPAVAPSTGTVQVEARRAEGAPAVGSTISLYVWRRPDPYLSLATARTDATGMARFDAVEPGPILAVGDVAGRAEGHAEAGRTTTLLLVFPQGCDVVGSVVDPAGHPVGGAQLWLGFDGGTAQDGSIVARSDGAGRFAIRGVDGTRNLGARAPGFTPSRLQWVQGTPGSTVEVTIAFEQRGGRVTGVVVDDAGAPVAGAVVQLGDEEKPLRSPATSRFQTSSPLLLRACTDADGCFEIDGTPLGELPLAVRKEGFAPAVTKVAIEEHAPTDVEIVLGEGATLEGTVRDGAGAPIAGATLALGVEWHFTSSTRTSGPDGAFRFDHAPVGPVDARATRGESGARVAERLELRDGETARWDPVLAGGTTLRLRIVADDGTPQPECQVEVSGRRDGPAGEWFHARTASDADGRAVLEGCPSGPLRVSVLAPWPGWSRLKLFEQLRAGGEEVEVVVDPALLPSVRLLGRVVGSDGLPLVNASVAADASTMDSTRPMFEVDADGRFDIGTFAPGDFEVSVVAAGYVRSTTRVLAVAAGETRDLGELRLERGASIRLRWQLSEALRARVAAAPEAASLVLRSAAGDPIDRVRPRDGAFVPQAWTLAPGRIEVELVLAGEVAASAVLEVVAGADALDVDLQ